MRRKCLKVDLADIRHRGRCFWRVRQEQELEPCTLYFGFVDTKPVVPVSGQHSAGTEPPGPIIAMLCRLAHCSRHMVGSERFNTGACANQLQYPLQCFLRGTWSTFGRICRYVIGWGTHGRCLRDGCRGWGGRRVGACAQSEAGEQGVEGARDHEASVVRWCGCDASGIRHRGQSQGVWQPQHHRRTLRALAGTSTSGNTSINNCPAPAVMRSLVPMAKPKCSSHRPLRRTWGTCWSPAWSWAPG